MAVMLGLGAALAAVIWPRAAELPSDLPGALEAARKHYRLPAMAGAVITSSGIRKAVTGKRRLDRGAAVAETDLWHLGSNTKAMTATLAAILAAQGVVTPQERAAAVFGPPIHEGYREVTLHDLLLHRSGIAAFTEPQELEGYEDTITGTPRQQRRAFAKRLLSQPPAGQPGEYLYSNAGYGVAAAILEAKAGASWEDLLNAKLLKPLGLHARIGWPATAQDPDQPYGHSVTGLALEPQELDDDYDVPALLDPAADVSMSIGDYARFVQLHLRGLRGQPTLAVAGPGTGREVISAELIRELHEPVGDYSCGWIESTEQGYKSSSHDGSVATFYCTVTIVPEIDLAVVVVTNAGGDAAEAAVHAVADRLLSASAAPR